MGEAPPVMTARHLFLLLLAGWLGVDSGAAIAGEVERFAVVIGHNRGDPDQDPLRYAEDDATKVHGVLRDFGSFAPENIVLSQGGDASTVRRMLIDINDRIRARSGQPGVETSLLVYYSGHADGDALQMGGSRLPIVELEKLVRGSSAGFRLLVLDACRSGTLTRVKGGRSAPPLLIEVMDGVRNEGVVFLTAASANEDAQESDELKGSFFTHYLVSGLLGAADTNGDGQVVLDEAYRYAYEHTLRASSRTTAGTQHPTFRYELKGRGHVVLTDLRTLRNRSALQFPAGRGYLVFQEDRHGHVVAEIGPAAGVRLLYLRPGRYFVRGRGASFLLEGKVALGNGERRLVQDAELERVEYARLVRKGPGPERMLGAQAGLRARGALAGGAGPCLGGFLGGGLDFRKLSLATRVGACRGQRNGSHLRETVDELDLELRGTVAWDLPRLTVELGVSAGGAIFRQAFSTQGLAPRRWAGAGNVGAGVGIQTELGKGLYVHADLAAQTYFFREQSSAGGRRVSFVSPFALRSAAGIGMRW
jgi:hypothetical protein